MESSFKELFRKSAFAAKVVKGMPIVAKNMETGIFQGSHLGLKRNLPVTPYFDKTVQIHDLDKTYSYTVFEDISDDLKLQKLKKWIIWKSKGHDNELLDMEQRRIQGRILGKADKYNYSVGLAGLIALLPGYQTVLGPRENPNNPDMTVRDFFIKSAIFESKRTQILVSMKYPFNSNYRY